MADYKPVDLHVGIIDLFSILMPGALLSGGLVAWWGDRHPPAPFAALLDTPAAQWVAFAVGAYALGHFAFLAAARLDGLYDRYRRHRWPNRRDDAYGAATALRHRYFGRSDVPDARFDAMSSGVDPLPALNAFLKAVRPAEAGEKPKGDDWPLNTFRWAKALLMTAAPAGAALVERHEADSKFFRSLIVVLPIVGALLSWRGGWWWLPLALALAFLSFFLFAERRHKSTEWAYHLVIVLMRERGAGAIGLPVSSAAPADAAGG